jgi:hypothetical protein
MSFLFWKEGRKALTIYASFLVVALAYWWIFESGPKAIGETINFSGLAAFLAEGGALIFAAPAALPGAHFPGLVMLIGVGSSDFGFAGELRAMRALPVARSASQRCLTGFGVLDAAMLWVALLAAHLIATGTPPQSLRPDLFFVVAGAMALANAVQLILPAKPVFESTRQRHRVCAGVDRVLIETRGSGQRL